MGTNWICIGHHQVVPFQKSFPPELMGIIIARAPVSMLPALMLLSHGYRSSDMTYVSFNYTSHLGTDSHVYVMHNATPDITPPEPCESGIRGCDWACAPVVQWSLDEPTTHGDIVREYIILSSYFGTSRKLYTHREAFGRVFSWWYHWERDCEVLSCVNEEAYITGM